MNPFIESLVVLAIVLIFARFIKRGSDTLQRLFIPSALVAGFMGLALGPQGFHLITPEVTNYWAEWPQYLITIVFAGLFLGKIIPSRKLLWKSAGPMIAFGNTLAWGQYVLGIGVTLLFLTPVFGVNPLAGALVEIGFEGGHGTAAGLAPTFSELGWSEGTDLALALATFSIVCAIVLGLLYVNWHNRKGGGHGVDPEEQARQRRQMVRSGYNLIAFGRRLRTSPKDALITIAAFAVSIWFGWVMLQCCIIAEDWALRSFTDMRFFSHLPLFPMAILGGLIVQMSLRRAGYSHLISRRTAEIISTLALDVLIASAIATVSLSAIGNNLPVFITFALVGVGWIVFAFLFFAPRMFATFWYEKGLTNTGQSMGMTATGLLLGRLADPNNHSKARESFAYKQLAFEPFMGGGIVTASSVICIHEFGPVPVLVVCAIITAFWIWLGLHVKRKASR